MELAIFKLAPIFVALLGSSLAYPMREESFSVSDVREEAPPETNDLLPQEEESPRKYPFFDLGVDKQNGANSAWSTSWDESSDTKWAGDDDTLGVPQLQKEHETPSNQFPYYLPSLYWDQPRQFREHGPMMMPSGIYGGYPTEHDSSESSEQVKPLKKKKKVQEAAG